MLELSDTIINFLHKQGFVIVSTIDSNGAIHCSAKGIVGIDKEGRVYLIDLYRTHTFSNLQANPTMSITAVDERRFAGYALKGKAQIVERKKIKSHIIKKWEERVVERISKRLIKNVQEERKSSSNPESHLPSPQYLVVFEVEEIVDLTPAHIKRG